MICLREIEILDTYPSIIINTSRNSINNKLHIQTQNLIYRSGTATIGRVFGRGIGYIAQIVLARVLAPEGFGLFAIGWTILRLFSITGHLGLDFGVITFGARYWQKDQHKLRSVIVISLGGALLSGVLFGILIYISAPWLAIHFFNKPDLEPILRGFAFTFPFATTLRVLAATNSISGKMLCGAFAEDITQPILQILLFFVLYNMGMGLNAAILSTIISFGISVIAGFMCIGGNIPGFFSLEKISMEDALPVLRYSLPAIVGVTLGAFNLWGDRLIVGYFSTAVQTGIYQSISVITMFTTILLSGIKISIAPVISQMFHNNDLAGVQLLARSITRWALYISMPFLLTAFVAPNDILGAIFGNKYQEGAIPLLLLTIGQLFYVMFGLTDQFFLMTGKQKAWLRISLIIFLLTIFFDAILIPKIGLIGASIVSSTMMFLLGIISTTTLRNYLGVWLFDVSHLKILIASALTALATYIIVNNLTLSYIQSIAITFILSTSLFLLFLWLTGIESSDKSIINQFIHHRDPNKHN